MAHLILLQGPGPDPTQVQLPDIGEAMGWPAAIVLLGAMILFGWFLYLYFKSIDNL